jgi:hypothetical protein
MSETPSSNLSKSQQSAIRRVADKYNKRTVEADDLRRQLDGLVLEARASDPPGTFREIAALASRSIAWVQGSLARSQKRSQ